MKIYVVTVPGNYFAASVFCNAKNLAEYVVQFEKVGDYTLIVLKLPKEFDTKGL